MVDGEEDCEYFPELAFDLLTKVAFILYTRKLVKVLHTYYDNFLRIRKMTIG